MTAQVRTEPVGSRREKATPLEATATPSVPGPASGPPACMHHSAGGSHAVFRQVPQQVPPSAEYRCAPTRRQPCTIDRWLSGVIFARKPALLRRGHVAAPRKREIAPFECARSGERWNPVFRRRGTPRVEHGLPSGCSGCHSRDAKAPLRATIPAWIRPLRSPASSTVVRRSARIRDRGAGAFGCNSAAPGRPVLRLSARRHAGALRAARANGSAACSRSYPCCAQ